MDKARGESVALATRPTKQRSPVET